MVYYDKSFDKVKHGSESRNPLVRAFFRLRLKYLINRIGVFEPNKLLDLGCGDGRLLKEMNNDAIGLDLSHLRLQNCKKLKHILLQSDSTNLPFRNNCFTFITTIGLLEHVPNYKMVIEEAYRIMKEGAKIIIICPNEKIMTIFRVLSGRFYKHTHSHEFNPKLLMKQIEKVGFQITKFKTFPLNLPFYFSVCFMIEGEKRARVGIY